MDFMRERRGAYRVLVGKLLGKLGLDGRIILKCIFKNVDGVWTLLMCLGKGQIVVSREHGDEPSGSVKYGDFFFD
jgi:hypothetical protein